MGKRKQSRRRGKPPVERERYTDPQGNVLVLRKALSAATVAKINEAPKSEAATIDDAWQRREELLFERLVISWEIAGLPLDDQKMLLGRYRMSGPVERHWVRTTIAEHIEAWIPGLEPPRAT